MAAVKSDLKFYLTSAQPYVTQASPTQSIGGFLSTTALSPNTFLASDLQVAPLTMYTTSSINKPPKVLVGDEIILVNGFGVSGYSGFSGYSGQSGYSGSGYNYALKQRGALQSEPKFHYAGTAVYDVSSKGLFNSSLNSDGKQYRCVAVKNTGTGIFYNVSFYVKDASLNQNCTIKIAVEVPSTDIETSVATGGSTISLIDTSLIGVILDETPYINTVFRITSGSNINQVRQIASLDTATGAITFTQAMPYAIASGTNYVIENAPAQRGSSGLISPAFGTTNVSILSAANGVNSSISINRASRIHGAHLFPNETVYVWFERTLGNNVDTYVDNRVVFSVNYTTI